MLGVAVAARDRPAPRPLDRRDSILFFEISEAAPSPAAVVLMLRALASTGALCESCGILFGRPFGDEAEFDAYDAAVLQVLADGCLNRPPSGDVLACR